MKSDFSSSMLFLTFNNQNNPKLKGIIIKRKFAIPPQLAKVNAEKNPINNPNKIDLIKGYFFASSLSRKFNKRPYKPMVIKNINIPRGS